MASSAGRTSRAPRLSFAWSLTWRWVAFALGALAVTYLMLDRGVAAGLTTAIGVALLVIALTLTPRIPMAIPLMSMPVLFVVARLGAGNVNLTVSDAMLAAAFAAALLFAERPFSRELRALLWFNAIYQFATLITVIVNPFVQNSVEFFHAWLLISGALVVGWGVGAAGYAKLAFNLMIGAALVIAASTIATGVLHYVHGDFKPVFPSWPFAMNKNFAGTAMAFAALIVYVDPPWAMFKRSTRRTLLTVFAIAILFTQSRQALIGLIVAIILVVSRRRLFGHSRLVLLMIIPAVILVISMVHDQIVSQNKFNSVFQRLNWLKELYAYWKHEPFVGHGLRYWYVNPDMNYQPPQGEVEVLVTSGLIGLVAFLVMWIGIIVVLWRMDPAYGTLAATAVISRLVQAQFDLFWVSAQVSIPFAIAGICLGAAEYAKKHPPGGAGEEALPAAVDEGAFRPRTGARTSAG
ncbi:O-antigen ligase family protein [Microbacterium mangrovi]|uniref:O-antigen ligase family protein n=1 Tax=Microbacterium mangrovi TaxID=1348253 RepID=UPI0012E04006|nr:O-antigen ligase family protein [Microbacterium mangrovi]